MTNHWIDLKNADCILVMGSNAAANHPISFKWIYRAMDAGATLISVDPRYNRTAAKSDVYIRLRSGTDIALLGGMINYIISNKRFHHDYLANYTNAAFILNPDFGFSDGLFTGYRPDQRVYDKSSWTFVRDRNGLARRDPSLSDPNCVFQQLKKHYSRYSSHKVSSIAGTPVDDLLKVWDVFSKTGASDKTGTILYAMGGTQHTIGVQIIRAMAIVQLLLGNMGRPGGGINALRGESNVQGSTDHSLLFHIWPGYLEAARASQQTLFQYRKKNTPRSENRHSANWWQHKPKYMVSYLKAMFGDSAAAENEFGYGWMPKLDEHRTYSWLDLFEAMSMGRFEGFFAWGQNPAVSGANAGNTRKALGKLDWLVNVNLFDNETASFWKGPGMDPGKIKTEVFLLPCAASMEKAGSVTNSGRWMQWRSQAVDPPGEAKSDGQIMVDLWQRVRRLYKNGKGVFSGPIHHFRPDLFKTGRYDPNQVARLINGQFEKETTIQGKIYPKGSQVPSFAYLRDDGTTASGNWLYCGSYTGAGNMAARRKKADPSGMGLYPQWAWCWPLNRRILYNRASVNINGQPWSANKEVLRWNGIDRWIGDIPDGGWPPTAKLPFIMKTDGVASIFGPGLADGPFPEHYEPFESPLEVNPFSSQRVDPVLPVHGSFGDIRTAYNSRYPIVATTHRVAEHWQTGVMSRRMPWLLETQPALFVEMSHELARIRKIKNGDRCIVTSVHGELEAVALVSFKLQPMTVAGQIVHQVSLPWCYGWLYPKERGDAANLLTPAIGDPNTRIPETKAFMVNVIKKART